MTLPAQELLAYTTEQHQQQSGGAYGLSEAEDADGYGYGFYDQPLYGDHQPYTHFDHPCTLPDALPSQLLQLGTEGEDSLGPVAVAALEALAEQPAPAAPAPAAAAGVGSGGGDRGAAEAAACPDAVAAVGGPGGHAASVVEGKETHTEGALAAAALAGGGCETHVQGAGEADAVERGSVGVVAAAVERGSVGGVAGAEDVGELWEGAACSWGELEVGLGLGLGEALEGEHAPPAPLHDLEELHAAATGGVHPAPQEAALAAPGLPALEAEAASAAAAARALHITSVERQESGRISCELEACALRGEAEPDGAAQLERGSSRGSSAGTPPPEELMPTAPCSLTGDVEAMASRHGPADQLTSGLPYAAPPEPPCHAEAEGSGAGDRDQELLMHSSSATAVEDGGAAALPGDRNVDVSTATRSEPSAPAKPKRLYPPASRATGAPLTHRAPVPSLPPQPPARVSSSGGDAPQLPRTARPGLQQAVQLPQASLPLQQPQQEQEQLLQQQFFGDTDKAPKRCGSYPDGWEVLDEEGESLPAGKGGPVPQPSSEAGQLSVGSSPGMGGDRGPRSQSVGGYPVAGVCSSPGAVGPEHAGQVGGWLMGHEMVSEAVAATHVIPVESGSEEEGEDAGERL